MKFLPTFVFVFGYLATLFVVIARSEDSDYAEGFVCEVGVSYVENECNRCICGAGNNLGCTRKLCPGDRYKELKHCEVNTKWEEDCNQCWCVKDRGTICTGFNCDGDQAIDESENAVEVD